jgi:hypothetical protein
MKDKKKALFQGITSIFHKFSMKKKKRHALDFDFFEELMAKYIDNVDIFLKNRSQNNTILGKIRLLQKKNIIQQKKNVLLIHKKIQLLQKEIEKSYKKDSLTILEKCRLLENQKTLTILQKCQLLFTKAILDSERIDIIEQYNNTTKIVHSEKVPINEILQNK